MQNSKTSMDGWNEDVSTGTSEDKSMGQLKDKVIEVEDSNTREGHGT